MPLIELNLPAGMYKNGTPHTRKGRYVDGNLVRWHDGAVRPIGGWTRRSDSTGAEIAEIIADADLEAVREIFSWRDLGNTSQVVLGSNLALYHLSSTGIVTDITYAGYAALNSSKDASVQSGYGQNPFGVGAYGVANNLIGAAPNPPDRWYFDNFGEILLTGVRNNGGLYELDLGTLTLSLVTGAPTGIQDMCVTDQRQVLTIGGAGEPRRVRSSAIEDRNNWTPAVANQSIDRTLTGTGKLLRCINVLRQVLILGESDAYVARYVGPPYVQSIDLAGENCGPIAAEAVTRTDRFAVWWGDRQFWLFDGSIQPLPCDVIDFLYADLDETQVSKITAFTNTEYSEVWWMYQSTGSLTGEVDSYVAWDYKEQHWSTGRLDRTAGVDKKVLQSQLQVSPTGGIFNHELTSVIPDGDVFVTTGTIQIGRGDTNLAVRYIYPDTEATAGIQFTLLGKQLPNAEEYEYGPYTYQQQQPIPTRAIGRSIRLKTTMTDANAELGTVRLDVAPQGTGKR